MSNKITKADDSLEVSWRALMDELSLSVGEEDVLLRDKVVRGAEMLLLGYSIKEVAEALRVTQTTVKSWVNTYPVVSHIISEKKDLLRRWRLEQMDKQFLLALQKSQEILTLDPSYEVTYDDKGNEHIIYASPVNVRLVAAQAQHARFMMEQFAKLHDDVEVTQRGEGLKLSASEAALATIMDKLAQTIHNSGDRPIEIIYQLEDRDKVNQPYFDQLGNPLHGRMGEVATGEEGVECHICGHHYKAFRNHLRLRHDLDLEVYCDLFMLEEVAVTEAEAFVNDSK